MPTADHAGTLAGYGLVAAELAVTGWLLWRLTHRPHGIAAPPAEDAAERIRRELSRLLSRGALPHVLCGSTRRPSWARRWRRETSPEACSAPPPLARPVGSLYL